LQRKPDFFNNPFLKKRASALYIIDFCINNGRKINIPQTPSPLSSSASGGEGVKKIKSGWGKSLLLSGGRKNSLAKIGGTGMIRNG